MKKKLTKKQIELDIIGEDKYDRKVSKIFLKSKDINLEMRRTGHAKYPKKYAPYEFDYFLG